MDVSKSTTAGALATLLLVAACASKEPAAGSATPAALGFACAGDSDCASGLCIEESRAGTSVSWTGGTCTRECTANPCEAASSCVAFSDGTSWCVAGCGQSSDCRAGYVCSLAVSGCLPDCRLGFSCGTSLSCDPTTGACGPGIQGIGAPCTGDAECKSGLCTVEQSNASGKQWAGGYCTQVCTSSTPCQDAASCITYEDGSSYCAASCASTSDCRTGYVCSAAAKLCLPDCRQGWSCGTALTCDDLTGNCTGMTLDIGAACATADDCASGLCIPAQSTATGTAWNGGYCTALCDGGAPCPASSQCIDYADGSSCAVSCTGDTECRTGYVCNPEVLACLPDCRQGFSCGSTLACDAATGSCS